MRAGRAHGRPPAGARLRGWAETSLLNPSFENCVDLADTMSPEELRANATSLARFGLGAALHDQGAASIVYVNRSVEHAAELGLPRRWCPGCSRTSRSPSTS